MILISSRRPAFVVASLRTQFATRRVILLGKFLLLPSLFFCLTV